MAKLIWFVVLVISLTLVFVLKSYKALPVDNTDFQTQVRMEKDAAEKVRQEALATAKALEEAANKKKEPELVLDTPELQNGHEVYFKKGKCITCHGNKGQGKKSQQAPKLSGQHDWYVYSSLVKVKNGERVVEKMYPYLRSLSDQDFKDVALYLSKLPPQ